MKKIFALCVLILGSFSQQTMAQQILINPVIQSLAARHGIFSKE